MAIDSSKANQSVCRGGHGLIGLSMPIISVSEGWPRIQGQQRCFIRIIVEVPAPKMQWQGVSAKLVLDQLARVAAKKMYAHSAPE